MLYLLDCQTALGTCAFPTEANKSEGRRQPFDNSHAIPIVHLFKSLANQITNYMSFKQHERDTHKS